MVGTRCIVSALRGVNHENIPSCVAPAIVRGRPRSGRAAARPYGWAFHDNLGVVVTRCFVSALRRVNHENNPLLAEPANFRGRPKPGRAAARPYGGVFHENFWGGWDTKHRVRFARGESRIYSIVRGASLCSWSSEARARSSAPLRWGENHIDNRGGHKSQKKPHRGFCEANGLDQVINYTMLAANFSPYSSRALTISCVRPSA
jgi:hypothetical protein